MVISPDVHPGGAALDALPGGTAVWNGSDLCITAAGLDAGAGNVLVVRLADGHIDSVAGSDVWPLAAVEIVPGTPAAAPAPPQAPAEPGGGGPAPTQAGAPGQQQPARPPAGSSAHQRPGRR